jgi:hypothetical protein
MATQARRQPGGNGPAFSLGRLLATPGALRALNALNLTPIRLIARHAAGDWGDLCEEDKHANEEALKEGARLLSAYAFGDVRFYVITEADRSATTVLLPEGAP